MRPQDSFYLFDLWRSQWQDPSALARRQEQALQRLVRHAYERVPYYRRLFDSVGLKPEAIRHTADLANLPITSRENLAGLPLEDRLAHGSYVERCRRAVTSGSTGVPLTILHRPLDQTRLNLAWGRVYLAHGVKPWHWLVGFSGQRELPQGRSWYQHLGLMRRRTISTWEDPARWIEKLRVWKPQALTGYVMTLKLLALAVQARGISEIQPQVVFQSSGLLDDESRRLVESALHTRVVDIYGSAEAGCIAWECPACSGYHVNTDLLVVELLDGDRPVPPGVPGEVVVTNLHSYAMPFIRYRQGDIAVWASELPECGRGLPLMGVVQGRLGDFIVLPSGQRLSPHPFFVALDTTAGIARWSLVQEAPHRLNIRIVTGGRAAGTVEAEARAKVQAIVGPDVEIAVFPVDSLEYDPARKFRSVQSRMY